MKTLQTPFQMRSPFLLVLALLCGGGLSLGAADWQTLFNGKDLSGWRANYYSNSWSVVDGTIRAHATKASSHLFFVGDKPAGEFVPFTNFVLELSARSETNANSGVFFHTDYKAPNAQHHLANGYEVQLNSTGIEKRKTGSLYAVVDLPKSPVDESQWFRVRITVQGRHIVVQLNDKTVVDYTEPANVQRKRHLNPIYPNPGWGVVEVGDEVESRCCTAAATIESSATRGAPGGVGAQPAGGR